MVYLYVFLLSCLIFVRNCSCSMKFSWSDIACFGIFIKFMFFILFEFSFKSIISIFFWSNSLLIRCQLLIAINSYNVYAFSQGRFKSIYIRISLLYFAYNYYRVAIAFNYFSFAVRLFRLWRLFIEMSNGFLG